MFDLREVRRLPDLASIRKWDPDSSWVLTRCEVLGHELAEGIQYRQLWAQTTEQQRGGRTDTAYTTRARTAHEYALRIAVGCRYAQHVQRLEKLPLANAIDDACGVRIMQMPLNAETVYRALRAKQGTPLEDE